MKGRPERYERPFCMGFGGCCVALPMTLTLLLALLLTVTLSLAQLLVLLLTVTLSLGQLLMPLLLALPLRFLLSLPSWRAGQCPACSAGFSVPQAAVRTRDSTAPVCEFRRNSSPCRPASDAAFTTAPSGVSTRVPAVM